MARHCTIVLEFQQKIVDAMLHGETISGVTQQFEFPYSTVYSVLQQYEEEGSIEAGLHGGPCCQRCIQGHHLDFLIEVISSRPGAMLEELRQELLQHFPELGSISLSTLNKALKDCAHMMLKRLSVEHDHHNKAEMMAAQQEYIAASRNGIEAHQTIIGA